jgi:hypothetical protein
LVEDRFLGSPPLVVYTQWPACTAGEAD